MNGVHHVDAYDDLRDTLVNKALEWGRTKIGRCYHDSGALHTISAANSA